MDVSAGPLRPRARWALRIALVIAWASGVSGTVTSCALLSHYRGPIPQRVASAGSSSVASAKASAASAASSAALPPASVAPSAVALAPSGVAPAPSAAPARSAFGISEAEAEVMTDAFERFRRTRLPLTAANFVLSIALVVGAARTMGRRPGGLSWLRQVCLATVLYACAEHVVSRDERAFVAQQLPAVRAVHVEHPGLTREQAEQTFRAGVHFKYLLSLLAQLGLYGGLALALGRPVVVRELAAEDGGRASLPPSSEDDDES